MANQQITTFESFLDALVPIATEDVRVQALWIEANERSSLRRPFGTDVVIHAVANEPDFGPLVASWESIVTRLSPIAVPTWSDTQRNARQLEGQIQLAGGETRAIRFVIECAAFLAKRSRHAVVALVDKTQHLIHVMDFAR
jgi:hypothetical protein